MGTEKNVVLAGAFLKEIKGVIRNARRAAFDAVNIELLRAYFEIGKRIVEEEQRGKARAGYGRNLLELLSGELCREFGRGFDASNLRRMRRFYLTYLKWETVSPKLSWSHYCELIKIEEPEKRAYFQRYVEQESLSIRDLKRQVYSLHYERLLMSRDKKAFVRSERKTFVPAKTEELIKDPYVLEFLDFFGHRPQNKVLDFLLENRIFDYSRKEIAEHTGVGLGVLDSFWDRLLDKKRVVETRRIGKSPMYAPNVESPLVKRLIELDFELTFGESPGNNPGKAAQSVG